MANWEHFRLKQEHAAILLGVCFIGLLVNAACATSAAPPSLVEPISTLIPSRQPPALMATCTKEPIPTATPKPQAKETCLTLTNINDAGTLTRIRPATNEQLLFVLTNNPNISEKIHDLTLLRLTGSTKYTVGKSIYFYPRPPDSSIFPTQITLDIDAALINDGVQYQCQTTNKTISNGNPKTVIAQEIKSCEIKCDKYYWRPQLLPPVTPSP